MDNLKEKSKEELIKIIEKLRKTSDNPEHLSEINMQNILSAINDFVFVFDAEQQFIFVNIPDSQELFISSDKFLGKKPHEVMPDGIHQQFERAFGKNRQGQFSTFNFQLEINNKLLYYSARMSPVFKDKIFQGSVAVISDIGKGKKSIQNLIKEKDFSKKILETSNAVIVGLDKNHRIKLFNQSAEKIFGYNKEEVIDKDWFELFFSSEIIAEMNSVWKKSWGEKFYSYTNPILTKSGEERIISWQTTGFYDNKDDTKHLLISIGEDITCKIAAQNKLSESEIQFRSMFKQHHAIMLLIDPKTGSIKEANLAAEKFYGYSVATLCKMNIGKINCLSPEELKQKLYSAENKIDLRFIFQHKLSNNEIRTVEVHSEPIKIKDRNLLFSVIHDVSDRIKAEDELKEQKNKIQSIFRSAPIGIGVVSNRIFTNVNERFCEICGYSSDELINQSAEIIYPTKKEFDYVGKEKYTQIQKYGTGTVETQFKTKDGKIVDILLSSTPIDLNDLNKGVTFTALDISKIKKAQEELKLSETKFRIVAEHTNDWEYWIDENGNYKYLSPACERITGYLPDEFRNNPNLLYEMIHPDYKAKVHTHYHDEKKIHTPVFTMEFPIINKAGKEIWINHNCSPVFDKKGNFIGRRGNNRDVSDAKLAEFKIISQNEEYETLNEEYKTINEELKIALEKAENNEKLFMEIFHTVPDTIIITKISDGKISQINDEYIKTTGYTKEETIGKTMKEMNLWNNNEMLDKFIEILKKEGFASNFEAEFNIKNSKVISGLVSAEIIDINNEPHMLIITKDISEIKKTEKELTKYREHLEEMVKFRTEEIGTINEELTASNEELKSSNEELYIANKRLNKANKDLEEFNKLFIGREFRIKELKENIKNLEEKLKSK